ncbi:MAG: hypothetical protein J0M17_03445, partial [Planctomycetes bacterium]|nr:hypothetical protein [Planctomycetota bacterium]
MRFWLRSAVLPAVLCSCVAATRADDVKKDEPKKEPTVVALRDEEAPPKKDEPRKPEVRREEPRKEEPRREPPRKDEPRREEMRKPEPRPEGRPGFDPKAMEVRRKEFEERMEKSLGADKARQVRELMERARNAAREGGMNPERMREIHEQMRKILGDKAEAMRELMARGGPGPFAGRGPGPDARRPGPDGERKPEPRGPEGRGPEHKPGPDAKHG